MQAKRIQVGISPSTGIGGSGFVGLTVPTDPREQVNFHNMWYSFSCEPKDADANSQGNWVLYIVPAGGVFINWPDSTINNEVDNVRIIACGVWGASNQTPFNNGGQINTSRNLNPGDSLALSVTVTGTTAGQVSIKTMLCAHTVRK